MQYCQYIMPINKAVYLKSIDLMSRAVNAPFEKYQSARVKFVTTVADLASRPQHIEALHAAGILQIT